MKIVPALILFLPSTILLAVAVFDFYNGLTSNSGNANTNDLGQAGGNHHRYSSGAIEYVTGLGSTTTPPIPAAAAAAAVIPRLLEAGRHPVNSPSG